MAQNYYDMWKELGLELNAHDNLLNILNDVYKQTYLTEVHLLKTNLFYCIWLIIQTK